MSTPNPCLSCGACCACYRVSFHWLEGDDVTPGGVPTEMTDPLLPHRRVMKGTNDPSPRCLALNGIIGREVACGIHPNRPSVCREFTASWAEGARDERCDQARAKYGLPPLKPEDWLSPDREPEPEPTIPRPRRAA